MTEITGFQMVKKGNSISAFKDLMKEYEERQGLLTGPPFDPHLVNDNTVVLLDP
jgi:hypothetical protein